MDPAKQKQRHPLLGVREIHWDIIGTLKGWTGEARILSELYTQHRPAKEVSFPELLKKTHLKLFFSASQREN